MCSLAANDSPARLGSEDWIPRSIALQPVSCVNSPAIRYRDSVQGQDTKWATHRT